MIGWEKRTSPAGWQLAIPPAASIKSGWVTVATWSVDDAETLHLVGPATLYGHVGAELGDTAASGDVLLTFPREMKTQWLRASADGLTQRQPYAIGEARQWAGGASGPEKLALEDFPLRFQVWQRGGVMLATKVITVIDAPDARIAAGIAP